MENVHNIFEKLVDNISVKRETPQKTTPQQHKANEDGIARTMDVNRAANIPQKGTRVCVRKALFKDSFMDVAKCIRARIYAFMNIPPESCEVLKVGENKQLDKILEEYLKCYNNMGKSNVSTTCRLFTHTLPCLNFF